MSGAAEAGGASSSGPSPARTGAARHRRARGAVPKSARRRAMSLPKGLSWRRVHPITPLVRGWRVVAALIAIVSWRALDDIERVIELYRELREVEPGQYIQTARGWAADVSGGDPTTWLIGAAIILGLIVLVILALPFLSWRAMSYAVDADAVYLRSGILAKQLRIARLPRIQSIDITHPLLGRIVGLGQLSVEVAGGADSKVLIGYVRTRQLEALRREILDLAAGASTAGALPGAPSPAGAGMGAGAKGFEDAVGFPRVSEGVLDEAEHPLYAVEPRVLIASLMRSGTTASILTAVLFAAIGLLFILRTGADVLAILPIITGLFTIPMTLISLQWSSLARGWGFRAAATPAGIRMRYGLTDATSTTLPPGRVHAVGLVQSVLWRGKDWWRVDATVAGRAVTPSASKGAKKVFTRLLPVGPRDHALRALWLVVPDLGTPDPDALLAAALSGIDGAGAGPAAAPIGSAERGFIGVPRRARLFNPIAWRRKAIALTGTCVILRLNRWARRVSVIPYERIQSFRVLQGPLARRCGLATLRFDMVDSDVPVILSNLDAQHVTELSALIAARMARRGHDEHLDRWLSRVTASIS
ncbi:PH domain-containing protein [Actinomyces gaoshouyii]|uniref:PH domain-containing protein n=1 Tax=Actinomyces gaoshouyii TaxID=1960083 RepID=UPI001F0A18BD|nr:PH domain-containing protein [Actinomyces gaoshouyii]